MRLRDLADELERRRASSKDIVVDSANMQLVPAAGGQGVDSVQMAVEMPGADAEFFGVQPWAHAQLAAKTSIPKPYYDRMLNENRGELLAANVNAWLPDKERRMLRVQDGRVRAVVSDKFNVRLDNYGLAYAAMEVFDEFQVQGQRISVTAAELSDQHMYMKAIRDDLSYTVGTVMRRSQLIDDTVFMGVTLGNSEVGDGAFFVSPYMWRVVCQNGAINETTLRRVHIGERLEVGIFTEETLKLSDELLWRKVQDTLHAGFNEDVFAQWVDAVRAGREVVIERPTEVIENMATTFKITEDRKALLLDAFTEEAAMGNNTLWGLSNAVTRLAHLEGTAEGAVDLERLGAKIGVLAGTDELEELLTIPATPARRRK